MRYRVISTFLHRATGQYVEPGAECPALDDATAERLVRARCLVAEPAAPQIGVDLAGGESVTGVLTEAGVTAAAVAPAAPKSRRGRSKGK